MNKPLEMIKKVIKEIQYLLMGGCPNCHASWGRINTWVQPSCERPDYPDEYYRQCLDCGSSWNTF